MGRKHVATLMRMIGIAAPYRKPKTGTGTEPARRVYPYLLRNVAIDRVRHVWASDITFPMTKGLRFGIGDKKPEKL